MASESSSSLPAVDNTLGALQIGVLVSYLLFGITTAQTYTYYNRFKADSTWLKSGVAIVWALELAHALTIGMSTYFYTITDYGNRVSGLQNVHPSFIAVIFFTATVTCVCDPAFLHIPHPHALAGGRIIPAILATTSLVATSGTLAVCTGNNRTWTAMSAHWNTVILAACSLSVGVDVGIAGRLVHILLQTRQKEFAKTTALVNKIIASTIETGVLTSMCSLATIVFVNLISHGLTSKTNQSQYSTMSKTFIWVAILAIKSRLFSNSLLANLNARTKLRKLAEPPSFAFTRDVDLGEFGFSSGDNSENKGVGSGQTSEMA
ncbi:hypothetical protein MKEN_01410100 [Mycena kentingensis (nom. inval.)]|nr:hypothetical protein MKEN_01410100 [Mycena kentingensis (nom. inval.)]